MLEARLRDVANIAAVGIHQHDLAVVDPTCIKVMFKDDLAAVGRPVCGRRVTPDVCELSEPFPVLVHRVELKSETKIAGKDDRSVCACH